MHYLKIKQKIGFLKSWIESIWNLFCLHVWCRKSRQDFIQENNIVIVASFGNLLYVVYQRVKSFHILFSFLFLHKLLQKENTTASLLNSRSEHPHKSHVVHNTKVFAPHNPKRHALDILSMLPFKYTIIQMYVYLFEEYNI